MIDLSRDLRANWPNKPKLAPVQSVEDAPKEIIERLAEIEHNRWSGQAKKALYDMTDERRERWEKLAYIEYTDLDEHNKELDRMQVREYLPVIMEWLESRDAAQRQAGREERAGELEAMHDAWCDDIKERYAALVEAAREAKDAGEEIRLIEMYEDWEGGEPNLGTCKIMKKIREGSEKLDKALHELDEWREG